MADGPHPLSIRLKSSPLLLASILSAHLVAGAALLLMRLPPAGTVLLMLLVVASAVRAIRAQACKRGLSLVLAADGALRICRENGSDSWARVLPGAAIFPAAVWFALAWAEPDGRQRRLRLMLTAAEVTQEDGADAPWRRLRAWLRHRALERSGPEPVSPDET